MIEVQVIKRIPSPLDVRIYNQNAATHRTATATFLAKDYEAALKMARDCSKGVSEGTIVHVGITVVG